MNKNWVASAMTFGTSLTLSLLSVFVVIPVSGAASSTNLIGGPIRRLPPTDDRQWKLPVFAEIDDAGDALTPQISFDANANARAVWVQSDGLRRRTVSNRYSSIAGWGAAEPIDSGSGGDSVAPQIAVDPAGDALAVWIQPDGDHDRIEARANLAASGWAGIASLDLGEGNASGVQVAIDSQGRGLAIWSQSDGSRKRIWWARYTSAAGWVSSPTPIDSNVGDAQAPQLAFDVSGNALAVWQQFDGTRDRIFTNLFTGENWVGARTIDATGAGAGDASSPQVGFDPSGNALAVWVQFDVQRNHNRIFSNRAVVGNWVGATAIDTAALDAGDASVPQIAFDAAGNAAAVWVQSDGTNNIWANRFTPTGSWGTPGLIENDTGNGFSPAIAFDTNGNAVATWHQDNGARFSIRANFYSNVAGNWGDTAQPIESDNAGPAFKPRAGFDVNGTAVVVWYQSDGSRLNIKSARYTREKQFSPPVRVSIPAATSRQFTVNEQIIADGNGTVLALWEQLDDANGHNYWWNRFTAEAGWGTPQILMSIVHAKGLQVTFGKDGTATAVYADWDAGSQQHIFARRYISGTWGAPVVIDGQPSNHFGGDWPQVAVDANGDIVATWVNHISIATDPIRTDGFFSSKFHASTWSAPVQFGTGTANIGEPFVPAMQAFNANGTGVAIWRKLGPTGQPGEVWMNRYTAGNWGTSSQIDTHAADILSGPFPVRVVIDANGNVLLLWEGWPSNKLELRSQYFTVAGGWTSPAVLLSDMQGVQANAPNVEMTPDGSALASWPQLNAEGKVRLFRSRFVPNTGWGAIAPATPTTNEEQSDAFITEAGSARVMAWFQMGEDDDGAIFHLWAGRSTPGDVFRGQGTIDPKTVNAWQDSPHLLPDANGNVLAVWGRDDNQVQELWSSRLQ